MRKRGKSFKGQVRGFGNAAMEAIRKAQRAENTEAIAQRFLKAKTPEQLSREQILGISVGARSALEDVRVGRAIGDGVGWVVNAANISLLLAEVGYGPEHIPVIKQAQEALVRMINRHAEKGVFLLDGLGYQACREMLNVHEGQLECEELTDSVLMQVLEECKRRQEAGEVLDCVAA